MSTETELGKRTLTVERQLSFPVKDVWTAWTLPDHIVRWWGPPGMNVQIVSHEFEVGGTWKYVMTMPDGNEFGSEGVFSNIDPYSLIRTTADFKPMTTGVIMEYLFQPNDEGTLFTISCIFPTEEYCAQQEEMGFNRGWGSVLDRMVKHLKDQ